ncbi:MAG: TetR/AcrR family transcriptional regulator [Oscillospiraceae bacterium]|nr:TetR/AcrR family transcriptional regulator [Oscillospiraceae bacterium]
MEPLSIKVDSRLVFGAALERLLAKNSFQKITVNDITSECNAHRSTFYRYFSDKMELAEWYFRYLADQQASTVLKNFNPNDTVYGESVFLAILQMMQDKKQFFLKLAQYEGQNSFDKIFFRWNMDKVEESIRSSFSKDTLPQNILSSIKFYYYGETKLIIEWILSGMREKPEKVLEVAVENIPSPLRPYLKHDSGPQTQQGCEKK